MKLRTIEIDFDIHKLIELERVSFDEPEFMALRRLLKLPDTPELPDNSSESHSEGRPFVQGGVSVPHGSLAKMEYARGTQVYEGEFLDGYLVVGGKRYSSLSGAAVDLAVTRDGSKTNLNGWQYWKARFPGETRWRALRDLRDMAKSMRSSPV